MPEDSQSAEKTHYKLSIDGEAYLSDLQDKLGEMLKDDRFTIQKQ